MVRQNKAILRPRCDLTKNLFSSRILIRFISPNRYKTVFLYHQLLTSKKPLVSKIVKVIGHTSGKYAVVNRNNFYDSTILKFYKNLNCSKINLVMPKIFSEHLETHNTFDFEWHGIAAYEKMLALNPVFVCVKMVPLRCWLS